MALDPDVRTLLQTIESMNLPPFSEMRVEDVRKLMDENPILQPKEEIANTTDGEIEVNGHKSRYRLYVPGNSARELIVYIHGGGFVFGNISASESVCRRIANASGCKVMSIEYSLGPENKHPAASDDCFEAYRWIIDNADRLQVDKEKIVLCGDSAGANLSTVTCFRARDEGMKLPRLQVLFYPYVGPDFLSESQNNFREGYFLTEEEQRWFADLYLNSPADMMDPSFSPVFQTNFSGLPEAVVITGEYDPLRDQGETYLTMLQSAGVSTTGIRAKGMVHGFVSFINVVPAAWSIVTMVGALIGHKLRS